MHQSSFTKNIQGEIIGLAVGNHIIEIGSIWGAMANVATQEQQHTVCSSLTPFLMQLPENNLLSHHESVLKAIATLKSGQSVELCSQGGWEKTAVLSAIVHSDQVISSFGDGVISLSPVHPDVNDLLQSIWEAFYETDIPYKPTLSQICQQIQDKQALIVLDDGGKLIQSEVLELMNAASKCTFLIASSTNRIYGKGISIQLSRIFTSVAKTIVEDQLQRHKEDSLSTMLKKPEYLRIAVASIVSDGISLFTNWVQQHREELKSWWLEIDEIVQIIELAVKSSRWSDVLCLVEAVEGSIALSRRWGLWKQVLQWGLLAAQAEEDRVAEGWMLHQLGTRALCLGENTSAIDYLQAAIQIRESLGDSMGVSIGAHNLNLLPTTEFVNPQSLFVENMLSRMNVVVEPPSNRFTPRSVLPSPARILTAGILVAGGLLAWFNWHRFIPAPVVQTPSRNISSPAPPASPASPASPAPPTPPTPLLPYSPTPPAPSTHLPEYTPTVSPPLKLKIDEYKPTVGKKIMSKIILDTSIPTTIPIPSATPTAEVFPTPIAPELPLVELIPTPTTAQPNVELTPTPTPTQEQPTVVAPTPTFSLHNSVETPTAEVLPAPAVTVTPVEEQTK